MVGHEIGVDKGGLMNRGSGYCAEDSTQPWLYWADWMEEWKEDSNFEAKCHNGEPKESKEEIGCDFNEICEVCGTFVEMFDTKFCCKNCVHGDITIHWDTDSNGDLVFDCVCK